VEVVDKLDELDKIARIEARRDGRSHPKAVGQARGGDGKAAGHVRKSHVSGVENVQPIWHQIAPNVTQTGSRSNKNQTTITQFPPSLAPRLSEIRSDASLVEVAPGVFSREIFTPAPRHSHTLSDDPLLVEVASGVFMRVNSSAAVSDLSVESRADQMDGCRRQR